MAKIKQKLIVLKLVIILNILLIKCSSDEDFFINQNNLNTYLESVHNKINFSVNKCDDFINFACGKETLDNFVSNSDVVQQIFNNENILKLFGEKQPQDEVEKSLYNSLVQFPTEYVGKNITWEIVNSILKQIGDIKFKNADDNITSADIANVFTKLMYYEPKYIGPISFMKDYRKIEHKGLQIFAYLYRTGAVYTYTNQGKIITTLTVANLTEEIFEIKKFIENFENIFVEFNSKDNEIIDIICNTTEEFRTLLPTSTFDWDQLIPELQKDFDVINKQVIIRNIKLLEKYMKLFDSTKKSTIYNFYLSALVTALSESYQDYNSLYRLSVLSKFWHTKFEDEFSNKRILKFLNEFKQIYEKVNNFERLSLGSVELELMHFKEAVESHQKFYSNKIQDKLYRNIDMDPKKFYQNALTMRKIRGVYDKMFKDARSFIPTDSVVMNKISALINSPLLTDFKNKPYFYMYTTIAYELWWNIFDKHAPYNLVAENKYKKFKDMVLEELKKSEYTEIEKGLIKKNILNYLFFQNYAAHIYTKAIFHKAMNNSDYGLGAELNNSKNIIEKFNQFNLSSYGLIGLFQTFCENGKFSRAQELEKHLKLTEIFHNELNCPKTLETNAFEKLMKIKEIEDILHSLTFQSDLNKLDL